MKKRTRIILAAIIGGAFLLPAGYAAYRAYDHYCKCGSGSSVFRGAEEIREPNLPYSRSYDRDDSILARAYLRAPFELTRGNESRYHQVAEAFFNWRADTIAEGMLKNIVEIPDSVYIPGGSWLRDPDSPTGQANLLDMFKQEACKSLVWISIGKEDYEQAEKYRLLVKNKYNRTYSCIVRSPDYENGTKEMKTIILYRLKDYRGVIHNERNSFYENYHPWLAAAIQRQYTHQQICQEFKKAFSSIQFTPRPRWWFLSEIPDSAKATMTLFGEKIDMIAPELEAGKKAKKKDYIDRFKESFVYDELITGRPECD